MIKRLFDILFATTGLLFASPFFIVATIGIKVSSPGPIFYRAKRAGKDGNVFEMLKFRSMHIGNGGPVITAHEDPRIFWFGQFLRKAKIDELPQFLNVIYGDMSIVGPRPEDPLIVDRDYTAWMKETLAVRPGITSPGAIFYYAYGEELVSADDPEGSYVEKLLPPKLAIEQAYLKRATIFSDVGVIFHTAAAIVGQALGKPVSPSHKDINAATEWVSRDTFQALL